MFEGRRGGGKRQPWQVGERVGRRWDDKGMRTIRRGGLSCDAYCGQSKFTPVANLWPTT